MEINNIERNNNMELNKININEGIQKNFLESTLGKVINTTIDIGIRAILPDFLEDQIINIKDNLFNFGLKDGITKTIDDAIDLGKSAIGMVTGNFENVSQMHNVVKSGGLIDGVSSLFDTVLNKVEKAGAIDGNVVNVISKGKDLILNNLENNIEKSFDNQYEALNNMDKYIENWKKCFNNQDFDGMEKEYKKLSKQIKDIAPIEKTINQAKEIELLHNLIKNNGQNFNLTEEELELAKNLK